MPEIKIKHVVSFSSEDKVYKSENILNAETYRKWKCATPGEPKASIVLQFEKATQIHSIDIGNEGSAFVEILVGRSSDTVKDYQVLLVASSFMSPLESRNETHTGRVRMFGPEKLSQNLKDEKWDCVQVVCTQPFNKNITYGLSFIKFHSPPQKLEEQPSKEIKKAPVKLGAFTIKYDDDDDDEENSPSLFKSSQDSNESTKSLKFMSPSQGASSKVPPCDTPSSLRSPANPQKRKVDSNDSLATPPAKKDTSVYHVNKKKLVDILGNKSTEGSSNTDEDKSAKDTSRVKITNGSKDSPKNINTNKIPNSLKVTPSTATSSTNVKASKDSPRANGSKNVNKIGNKLFDKIMKDVVFVMSGFVNPQRSIIRDKALDMGAKYKADWDSQCTHLICAFENTPKYVQVKKAKGRIVTKDWIIDCHRTKCLLHWTKYMLGKYSRSSSSESEDEEPPPKKNNTNESKANGSNNSTERKKEAKYFQGKISVISEASKNKEDSETEDEDAIEDYQADTDADSGGDTEDELRKAENSMKKASKKEDEPLSEDDSSSLLGPSKPNTKDLPLPELPNFFKKRHFYLYGNFTKDKIFNLERYITAYDGVLDSYMGESTKYVITDARWDKNFEDALADNEDLVFVKSEWVFKCHEEQKFVPHQTYFVIPNQ